jgi:HSP20 family protein
LHYSRVKRKSGQHSKGKKVDRERRNPFHGLVDSISEWNRMREVGSGRIGPDTGHEDRRRTHATAWIPSTDVLARGRDLVIRVSLSGVSPEDVEITLSNDVLTVSGERRSDLDDQHEKFYVRERYYGVFRRSWTLPAGISDDDISADFENGLLEITVRGGAAATPEPRRIQIKRRA